MKYFPISIDVENKSVVVVGGGDVATRRVESLLECGAQVRVISPEVSECIAALESAGKVTLARRPYRNGDAEGALMILTAVDDAQVNRLVWEEARLRGILVNTADEPSRCDFIIPALVRRGDLTVAISTAGKSPALASRLRTQLEAMLGPEYGRLVEVLGRWRPRLRERFKNAEQRKLIHSRIVDSDALEFAREEDTEALERLLAQIVEETAEGGE